MPTCLYILFIVRGVTLVIAMLMYAISSFSVSLSCYLMSIGEMRIPRKIGTTLPEGTLLTYLKEREPQLPYVCRSGDADRIYGMLVGISFLQCLQLFWFMAPFESETYTTSFSKLPWRCRSFSYFAAFVSIHMHTELVIAVGTTALYGHQDYGVLYGSAVSLVYILFLHVFPDIVFSMIEKRVSKKKRKKKRMMRKR